MVYQFRGRMGTTYTLTTLPGFPIFVQGLTRGFRETSYKDDYIRRSGTGVKKPAPFLDAGFNLWTN